MPDAQWFPGVVMNYVDQVLRHTDRSGTAIVGVDELGNRTEITWRQLPHRIGAVAQQLCSLGIGRGDVVAGYLPDVPEAIVAFLGTAALGAIWSGCGRVYAPEGAASRLAQLRPKVLISADGYHYGGRWIDKRADTAELQRLLPGTPPTVVIDEGYGRTIGKACPPLVVESVPFDHPLWLVLSSGTTGKPKGIIHGHGGIVLEHLKIVGPQSNQGCDDVFFWHTMLSWMMWNFRLGGLLVGSTVLCYSGSPTYPDTDKLWQLVANEHVSYFGTSPGYMQACRNADLGPLCRHRLEALRIVGSTGSPLPWDLFTWIGASVGDAVVSSISGGTDVCTALAGGTPGVATIAGELSARYLGVDLHSWSPNRRKLINEVGEMVIVQPMPSMPIGFWRDHDRSIYRASYFDHEWEDGPTDWIWRHGYWVPITDRGPVIIHGRSDATLNRHGIRMGSADIYNVVEAIDEVVEAFVLGVHGPDGAYRMPLFVTLTPGLSIDDELRAKIRRDIRLKVSPRHVPDDILQAPGIPHTHTGKKLEVPISGVLAGRP